MVTIHALTLLADRVEFDHAPDPNQMNEFGGSEAVALSVLTTIANQVRGQIYFTVSGTRDARLAEYRDHLNGRISSPYETLIVLSRPGGPAWASSEHYHLAPFVEVSGTRKILYHDAGGGKFVHLQLGIVETQLAL